MELIWWLFGIQTVLAPTAQYYDSKPAKPTRVAVREEIIKQATEAHFPISTALTIGECESNLDPFVQNANSTATGVYQFIDGTWENYCEGYRTDYKANIACFIKLYPQHPSWWECQP